MKDFLLRAEAVAALVIAQVLVFVLPFRLTRRMFGPLCPAGPPHPEVAPDSLSRARAVVGRLRRVAARLPWHSTCLVMALSGRMLLVRRGLGGGVVRFGVKSENGRIAAHAWLMLGGETLLGGDEVPEYQPLADLA